MFYPKRFLLNVNTGEVHDTDNVKSDCYLSLISEDHKRWFDTLDEALSYPYHDGVRRNDGCAHCLPQYHTR